MGIDVKQFAECIVRPALKNIGLFSESAAQLVTGTAVTESRLKYLKQIKGPAMSVFQIEPSTHDDIWDNYIQYKPELKRRMWELAAPGLELIETLTGNLHYGAAMCRVFYRRIPTALPNAGDVEGMAVYWKKYYNTHLGKGTVEKAIPHFRSLIDVW